MKAFAETAVTNRQSRARLYFGEPRNIADLSRAAGRDLMGWRRRLGADEARKIIRDHGADALPIRPSSFRHLRAILDTPDALRVGEKVTKHRKLPVLISTKRIGGLTYEAVEEMQSGRRSLAVLTFYIVGRG